MGTQFPWILVTVQGPNLLAFQWRFNVCLLSSSVLKSHHLTEKL